MRCKSSNGDVCVDVTSDGQNCGACGVVCPTEGSCAGGACRCGDATKTLCGGACVDLSADASNCGACASVCAGTCISGRCAIELAIGGSPGSIFLDATNVYFADEKAGTVNVVPKNGGAVTVLASGQTYPSVLTSDGTSIFWSDETISPLQFGSVPIGGGTVTTLVTSDPDKGAVCLVVDDTNIYWNGYYAMPKGGGATKYLPNTYEIDQARHCVMNGSSIYSISDNEVLRMSLYGDITLLAFVTNGEEIGADTTNVYWSFGYPGTYSGLSKTGTGGGGAPVVTIASDPDPFLHQHIRLDGAYVYSFQSCTSTCGTITRTPTVGGPPVTIVDTIDDLVDVQIDATSIYWAEGKGRVMKLTPK
jgi:hypothetical protein